MDDNIRGPDQLGQMAICRHDLDYGFAPNVPIRQQEWPCPRLLCIMWQWTFYVAKEGLHIALEDGPGHTQGYVRAHVEEGVAELLHNH